MTENCESTEIHVQQTATVQQHHTTDPMNYPAAQCLTKHALLQICEESSKDNEASTVRHLEGMQEGLCRLTEAHI